MQIVPYFQINPRSFIIEGSNGYTMFKDPPMRGRVLVVGEIDRRRKAESKVCVYKQ